MAYKKLKLWFDAELAKLLSDKIYEVDSTFNKASFVASVDVAVEHLELKGRIEAIADLLRERLPDSYPEAVEILMKILGPENNKETGMFTEGYWVMPLTKFVEKYGLEHFRSSMKAIEEMTKRNTGEYCIRPFLREYTDKTLRKMMHWAKNKNTHVRRLASEGLRPRLPWASKLDMFIDDPTPILPVLELLKDDPSRYVQKSVANNLNDILKDNYLIGLDTIRQWAKDAGPQRRWVIKHSLRNLQKQGDLEAVVVLQSIGVDIH